MKNLSKKLVVLLLAAVMVFSFTACGGKSGGNEGGEGGDAAAPTLKIGSTGPLTGPAAIYGMSVKQGAELAVEEINANDKDLQIEFKMEDDEADGEKSVNAYNSLKDWGVQMLMGSVTTGSCITVSA